MTMIFPAAATVAALLLSVGVPAAHAQSGSDSLLRNQSRIVNQAVGSQARQGARPQAAGTLATVAARAVNLRAQPAPAAPVIGVLPQGTQLSVTGPAEGPWTPVEHQGRAGYVATSLLTPNR